MRIYFFIKTLRLYIFIYIKSSIYAGLRGLKKGLKEKIGFKTLRLLQNC